LPNISLVSGFTSLTENSFSRISYKVATGSESGQISVSEVTTCVVVRNATTSTLAFSSLANEGSLTFIVPTNNSLIMSFTQSEGDAGPGDNTGAPSGWTKQSGGYVSDTYSAVFSKNALVNAGSFTSTVGVSGYRRFISHVSISW
jgi:hypothetical protein